MYAANTRKDVFMINGRRERNRFRTFTAEPTESLSRLINPHHDIPLERQLYCPGNYLFFRCLTREKLISSH